MKFVANVLQIVNSSFVYFMVTLGILLLFTDGIDNKAVRRCRSTEDKRNIVQFRNSTGKLIATLKDPRNSNDANVTLSKNDDLRRYMDEIQHVVLANKRNVKDKHNKAAKRNELEKYIEKLKETVKNSGREKEVSNVGGKYRNVANSTTKNFKKKKNFEEEKHQHYYDNINKMMKSYKSVKQQENEISLLHEDEVLQIHTKPLEDPNYDIKPPESIPELEKVPFDWKKLLNVDDIADNIKFEKMDDEPCDSSKPSEPGANAHDGRERYDKPDGHHKQKREINDIRNTIVDVIDFYKELENLKDSETPKENRAVSAIKRSKIQKRPNESSHLHRKRIIVPKTEAKMFLKKPLENQDSSFLETTQGRSYSTFTPESIHEPFSKSNGALSGEEVATRHSILSAPSFPLEQFKNNQSSVTSNIGNLSNAALSPSLQESELFKSAPLITGTKEITRQNQLPSSLFDDKEMARIENGTAQSLDNEIINNIGTQHFNNVNKDLSLNLGNNDDKVNFDKAYQSKNQESTEPLISIPDAEQSEPIDNEASTYILHDQTIPDDTATLDNTTTNQISKNTSDSQSIRIQDIEYKLQAKRKDYQNATSKELVGAENRTSIIKEESLGSPIQHKNANVNYNEEENKNLKNDLTTYLDINMKNDSSINSSSPINMSIVHHNIDHINATLKAIKSNGSDSLASQITATPTIQSSATMSKPTSQSSSTMSKPTSQSSSTMSKPTNHIQTTSVASPKKNNSQNSIHQSGIGIDPNLAEQLNVTTNRSSKKNIQSYHKSKANLHRHHHYQKILIKSKHSDRQNIFSRNHDKSLKKQNAVEFKITQQQLTESIKHALLDFTKELKIEKNSNPFTRRNKKEEGQPTNNSSVSQSPLYNLDSSIFSSLDKSNHTRLDENAEKKSNHTKLDESTEKLENKHPYHELEKVNNRESMVELLKQLSLVQPTKQHLPQQQLSELRKVLKPSQQILNSQPLLNSQQLTKTSSSINKLSTDIQQPSVILGKESYQHLSFPLNVLTSNFLQDTRTENHKQCTMPYCECAEYPCSCYQPVCSCDRDCLCLSPPCYCSCNKASAIPVWVKILPVYSYSSGQSCICSFGTEDCKCNHLDPKFQHRHHLRIAKDCVTPFCLPSELPLEKSSFDCLRCCGHNNYNGDFQNPCYSACECGKRNKHPSLLSISGASDLTVSPHSPTNKETTDKILEPEIEQHKSGEILQNSVNTVNDKTVINKKNLSYSNVTSPELLAIVHPVKAVATKPTISVENPKRHESIILKSKLSSSKDQNKFTTIISASPMQHTKKTERISLQKRRHKKKQRHQTKKSNHIAKEINSESDQQHVNNSHIEPDETSIVVRELVRNVTHKALSESSNENLEERLANFLIEAFKNSHLTMRESNVPHHSNRHGRINISDPMNSLVPYQNISDNFFLASNENRATTQSIKSQNKETMNKHKRLKKNKNIDKNKLESKEIHYSQRTIPTKKFWQDFTIPTKALPKIGFDKFIDDNDKMPRDSLKFQSVQKSNSNIQNNIRKYESRQQQSKQGKSTSVYEIIPNKTRTQHSALLKYQSIETNRRSSIPRLPFVDGIKHKHFHLTRKKKRRKNAHRRKKIKRTVIK